MNNLVSIILSCHNTQREYFNQLLDGLYNQTYQNWELIICDHENNISTKDWISNDKRIKHLGEYNYNDQWEYLKNNSQGKIIIYHHDDDISLPHRIETQVKYLQNNPELDACSGGIISFGVGSEKTVNYPMKYEELKQNLIFWQPIMCPTLATRRNVVFDIDQTEKTAKIAKDYEWFSRRLDIKHDILPSILVKYRKHLKSDGALNKNQLRIDHANIICRNLKSQFGIEAPFELGQLLDPFANDIQISETKYNLCLDLFIANKDKIIDFCGKKIFDEKLKQMKSKRILKG